MRSGDLKDLSLDNSQAMIIRQSNRISKNSPFMYVMLSDKSLESVNEVVARNRISSSERSKPQSIMSNVPFGSSNGQRDSNMLGSRNRVESMQNSASTNNVFLPSNQSDERSQTLDQFNMKNDQNKLRPQPLLTGSLRSGQVSPSLVAARTVSNLDATSAISANIQDALSEEDDIEENDMPLILQVDSGERHGSSSTFNTKSSQSLGVDQQEVPAGNLLVVLRKSSQWNQYLLNKQIAVDLSKSNEIRFGPLDNPSSHQSEAIKQLKNSLLGNSQVS